MEDDTHAQLLHKKEEEEDYVLLEKEDIAMPCCDPSLL